IGKIFFSIFISCFLALSVVVAWVGVIAEDGDIITVAKWNELVAYIDQKLSPSNVIGAGSIQVTSSGSDITLSSDADGVAPYISSVLSFVPTNSTVSLLIEGEYFTPATTFSIPGFDGTINSVSVTSPTTMMVDLTTTSTQADYDIILANGAQQNTLWPGNGVDAISIANGPDGNGPAGTYTESFESGIGNWENTSGVVSFTRRSGSTPSNSTGPSGASSGSWYIYTEASGANINADFGIETDHFARIQNISFDYHMYGSDMGTLRFQTLYQGVWTDRWSLTGQQQTNQNDPYISQSIDLGMFPVERVRFFATAGGGFRSDFSIDNIVITSL
ncbi:hypothetical protein MK079_05030, partial [Candidatus Gracilibacteria bacterium]|nr:hypothetical protein [Candidatus Gracilibacteria bacterium]